MKKVILFTTAVVLLLSTAAFAAENTGIYLGVSGGYVIPSTMNLSRPDDHGHHTDVTLKNGYIAGVKAGWNTPFTNKILAMELEYNYIFGTDFDNGKIVPDTWLGSGPLTVDGTIKIHALLFNFKARYPEGRFHPYVGLGAGWSHLMVGDTIATSTEGHGTRLLRADSGDAFCYQLLAGLDFDITTNFGVGIGYKYFASKPTVGITEFDYKAHVVTLGLTYTF